MYVVLTDKKNHKTLCSTKYIFNNFKLLTDCIIYATIKYYLPALKLMQKVMLLLAFGTHI